MRAYRPSRFGGRDLEEDQETLKTKHENMVRYRRLADENLPLFGPVALGDARPGGQSTEWVSAST